MLFENDFKLLIPEVFLIFAICALLIFGSVYATTSELGNNKGSPLLLVPMSYLCSLTLIMGSLLAFNSKFQSGSILYGILYFDSLGVNGKGFLFLIGGACLLVSVGYLKNQGIYAFEYPLLILISSFAIGLLLSSYDFLGLYLSLELQSLALYVLASFKRGSAFSTEAGLKYFIVGAFSSGILLFGISLIYGSTGTINFEDLGRLFLSIEVSDLSSGLLGGLVFLSVGLFFKLAAAPFHMWSPDVYEGSPTSSSLFFAGLPKLAILILLMRIYYTAFYDLIDLWQNLLLVFSLTSIFVAALGGLQQRKIKRFLAYSSIGHVAFILIGLASGSLQGLQAVILYTIIYMVITLNIWTIILTSFRSGPLDSYQKSPIKYIDEIFAIPKINPGLALSITISIFSMAGIPPMAGFSAKMYVFFAAMESSLYFVAIIGVLTSVIGAFYYLRWVKIIYFEKISPKIGNHFYTYEFLIDRQTSIILSITTFFTLFFFAHPGPLLTLAHHMVLSLSILYTIF